MEEKQQTSVQYSASEADGHSRGPERMPSTGGDTSGRLIREGVAGSLLHLSGVQALGEGQGLRNVSRGRC